MEIRPIIPKKKKSLTQYVDLETYDFLSEKYKKYGMNSRSGFATEILNTFAREEINKKA